MQCIVLPQGPHSQILMMGGGGGGGSRKDTRIFLSRKKETEGVVKKGLRDFFGIQKKVW